MGSGLAVVASSGQEALLRFNIQLGKQAERSGLGGTIVEPVTLEDAGED